jgi:ribosomal protein S12
VTGEIFLAKTQRAPDSAMRKILEVLLTKISKEEVKL